MSIRLFPILFLLLTSSVPLFAQCPPPGFPDPGNTCPLAPILCENLDGYCSTINNNNLVQPFPCCNNGWTLNNDEWFAFFAGSTTITIEIIPQNCSDDGGLRGLQGGIYDGCPVNDCTAMAVQCACVEDPFMLHSDNYEIGKVYWIVLDGCNGNVCDYTVDVTQGSTVAFAPANPGAITGSVASCQGFSTTYAIPLVFGATNYTWTLTPSDAGVLTADSDSVTVVWSDTFNGFAKLCVATSNQCFQSASESCLDIEVLIKPTRSDSISFCPGDSIMLGGQVYTQSGTVVDTLPGIAGCDTVVTYALMLLQYQTRSENISLCPGESVTIGGQIYSQSGTIIDTIPSISSCDTIVTYTVSLLSQPTRSETIAFCPGETITLGGANYTQPGSVTLTIPSSTSGCDTIVTYTLQFLTPAASNIGITCPSAITINVSSGNTGTAVNYNQPSSTTDCVCPGISLALTGGLASGSIFPLGLSPVCFTAQDSCGQSAACCFNVTVEEEDDACDTKVNGCIKYELLSITEDLVKNRTYRIRVTNNCSNKLIHTAIQIPAGQVAIEPANFSVYTAPSGIKYLVRNPNFTPQYSIRFSSVTDSIHLGESDIFKYTLPAQASVTHFQVTSKLAPNTYLSAHLNTFNCPIGVTPTSNRPGGGRGDLSTAETLPNTKLLIYPNPASQIVSVETFGQAGELVVQDAMGRIVLRQTVDSDYTEFSVAGLANGLYQVVFYGERMVQYGTLMVAR